MRTRWICLDVARKPIAMRRRSRSYHGHSTPIRRFRNSITIWARSSGGSTGLRRRPSIFGKRSGLGQATPRRG